MFLFIFKFDENRGFLKNLVIFKQPTLWSEFPSIVNIKGLHRCLRLLMTWSSSYRLKNFAGLFRLIILKMMMIINLFLTILAISDATLFNRRYANIKVYIIISLRNLIISTRIYILRLWGKSRNCTMRIIHLIIS